MYDALAEYYDLFMDGGDWIDFAVDAVKGRGRGADVGCGSGNATIALAREHKVVAVDSSPEMLKVASQKFRRHALEIPVLLQSAEKLELGFKADFITATCDVVNYLRRPEKFFLAANKNLVKGGLLVFDISSEYKLRTVLGNNVFTETRGDVCYIWVNYLNKNSVDMELTFFAPSGNGLYKKAVDTQTQYIWGKQQIETLLNGCGFKSHCKVKKERLYFVAEKVNV